jgi:hypothetical protein
MDDIAFYSFPRNRFILRNELPDITALTAAKRASIAMPYSITSARS